MPDEQYRVKTKPAEWVNEVMILDTKVLGRLRVQCGFCLELRSQHGGHQPQVRRFIAMRGCHTGDHSSEAKYYIKDKQEPGELDQQSRALLLFRRTQVWLSAPLRWLTTIDSSSYWKLNFSARTYMPMAYPHTDTGIYTHTTYMWLTLTQTEAYT